MIEIVGSLAAAAIMIGASSGFLRVGAVVLSVVLIAVVAVRTRRIGVWADGTQVVVQNFFRTWEFPWADVLEVRVVLGRYRAWMFTLRDGRSVGAQGMPYRNLFGETHQLVSVASVPVEVDTGEARPDDFSARP